MLSTLLGIFIPFSSAQPEKAESPMFVTPSPMIACVSSLQPLNALSPMLITLFGIVILSNSLQHENASSAIQVVPCCTQ